MNTDLLEEILIVNQKRLDVLQKKYNPFTGQDAPGMRFEAVVEDFNDGNTLFLPVEMLKEPFIVALLNCRSFQAYIAKYLPDGDYITQRETILRYFIRLRCKHDFYFFAYVYARIKNKEGGPDIPFYLRPAQVKLVKTFEKLRKKSLAILVLLLKCRQWGGSTATDVYMGWIQIFWKTNWNSNIVGHMSTSAANVFAMYEKLIENIPIWLFFDLGEEYPPEVKKFAGVGTTQHIKEMVPRHCKIQTGSARNPESTRSADAAMVHLTEEAFFPSTTQWTPQQVVNAAISSVNVEMPLTFIVRETTPNGKNEFYDEWQKTKQIDEESGEKLSAYTAVFVAWFEIETYISPMTEDERANFAIELYRRRNDTKSHGDYFWWLWKKGATLEGIKWYKQKLRTMSSLENMQQEYPSDDIEAFRFGGNIVFDAYQLEELVNDCTLPDFIGDIEGDSVLPENKACMDNLRLTAKTGGPLKVWEMPDTTEKVRNRYIAAVDIGGAHQTSDYHDIVVLDRYDLAFGGVPAVVAEWHGHSPADQLAMKCAQIAAFYNNAFLVVENNTAYSRMNKTEGEISELFFPVLLPLYNNLYSGNKSKTLKRRQKETKWGFHTGRNNKPAIIQNYQHVLRKHAYIEREVEATIEMSYYTFNPDTGEYGAAPGYHDDRVMARAIALWVSDFDMDAPVIITPKTDEQLKQEEYAKRNTIVSTEIGNL